MSDQIAPVDHQQVGADFLRQQRPRVDADHAAAIGDQVFKAMHGFYGSLWLNKFSTGMASAGGGDEAAALLRLERSQLAVREVGTPLGQTRP